ncbi:MAG: hypothetical protein GY855_03585 [candidate division Zixibacteria bacterium]|nr:hypothetical protein [candidate division Zixibacteria bacterium]
MDQNDQNKLSLLYKILIGIVLFTVAFNIAINLNSILNNPDYYTSSLGAVYNWNPKSDGFFPVALILTLPLITLISVLMIMIKKDKPTAYFTAAIIIYLIINLLISLISK